jgi:hypothetical protein
VLTYRKDNCKIMFEVRNGVPGCTNINLVADETFLRPTDLSDIRLDDIRAEVYAIAGVGAFTPKGDDYELPPADARKAVQRATSRRKLLQSF